MKRLISKDSHGGIGWNESLLAGAGVVCESPAGSGLGNALGKPCLAHRNCHICTGRLRHREQRPPCCRGSEKCFYCSVFYPALGLMNVPCVGADIGPAVGFFWPGCCALLGRGGNALGATWPGKQIIGLLKSC